MKEHIGYDLIDTRQMIVKWGGVQIEELVEEEMRLSTEVEQNDFKAAIGQFTKRYQKVATKLDDII